MSRGHGRLQRWLLEEGLRDEPETLRGIAHRWVCYSENNPCTDTTDCCDAPGWQATRAERESVRRAIKRLADEPGTGVEWTTGWLVDLAGAELYAWRPSGAAGP